MTSRTRLWVLAVSTPVIAFAIVGGFLGQVIAKDDTYPHLRVFGDVVELVVQNYVEQVDVREAMQGAMRGLADGLDPDSAFVPPDLMKAIEANTPEPPGDIGLELTRQYYLRVVSARDGSPAARAGLRTGDYIRAIDGRATRDMSIVEGRRLLRGAVGAKVDLLVLRGNAAEPHEVTVVREQLNGADLTSRMADSTTGYIRVVEFTKESPSRLKQAVDTLARTGAARYVIDLRGTARGEIDAGIASARLFVQKASAAGGNGDVLTARQSKSQREVIAADTSDGAVTAPVVLLTDLGSAGAAEVFAAALRDNGRAELIGERTLGRAARQQLVKLPDGSGLLLSSVRYLTPKLEPIHERGLMPDVEVDQPLVEFGAPPPPGDPTLDRALEQFAAVKKAA
jgi:carboxyl-terminal processing protease